jgi:hypothetical protein
MSRRYVKLKGVILCDQVREPSQTYINLLVPQATHVSLGTPRQETAAVRFLETWHDVDFEPSMTNLDDRNEWNEVRRHGLRPRGLSQFALDIARLIKIQRIKKKEEEEEVMQGSSR